MAAAIAVAALTASPALAGSWLPFQSTGAGAAVSSPTIAVNERGDAIVAWTTGASLRTAFRPAGAAAFEAPQTAVGGTPGAPQIVLDANGNAAMIWLDNTNLDAIVRPAGGTWQSQQTLSAGFPPSSRIGIDSSGNVTVVYAEANNILARVRNAGGNFATAAFGAAVTLDNSVANASNVELAVHPSGAAVAAWQHVSTATFVAAAVRPAAGAAFGTAAALTNDPGGPNATTPDVAIDAAGNAVAVYNQLQGGQSSVAWSTRPAGGSWSPGPASTPQYLEGAGTVAAAGPQVRIDNAGNTIATWALTTPAPARIRAAVRQPGGTMGAAATLSDPTAAASAPVVAAGGGAPMVAWIQTVGTNSRVDSSVFEGGAWAPAQTASASDAAVGPLAAGMDDQGNASAVWESTLPEDAFAAVFDNVAPAFAVRAPDPTSAAAGSAFTFGVDNLSDRWSAIDPPAWDFGDGATAQGSAVQHAYGAAGSFAPSVTVRDAAGNSRTSSSPAVTVTAAQAPPEQPPSLPPPVLAKLVNATPVSGTVRVRLPGARQFVPLAVARQIPIGSIVDARKGRVRITGTDGRTVFFADFYEGMFRLGQRNRRGATIDIFLHGGSFRGCPRAPKAQLSARSKKRSIRHLWGDGSGRFRTVGRFSSASLRGTKWLTDDRCNGTRTRVAKGAVNVRDFVRRKTIVLRAPRSYFATRRR